MGVWDVGVGEWVRMCGCGSGSMRMCAVWDCVCGRVVGCDGRTGGWVLILS